MQSSHQPIFELYKVGQACERFINDALFSAMGIGFSQYRLLWVLEQRGPLQQNEIAMQLAQTEASISRQVKLLKEASFIRIELGADDKKRHVVSLTGAGRKATLHASEIIDGVYRQLLRGVSDKDQKQLTMILSRILLQCV